MRHPLDDEQILVTVILVHVSTGRSTQASVEAPADAVLTVFGATTQALEQAEDALLEELETQGG